MNKTSSVTNGERLEQIIHKIDEKEGGSSHPALSIVARRKNVAVGDSAPGRWDRFQKFAVLFSFVMNLILLLVVLALGTFLFQIKNAVAKPLLGGLVDGFVAMDQAHIISTIPVNTTIEVNDTIPVVFDVPLKTDTVVTLVQDTQIPNTIIYLNGAPIPLNIILPAGTPLSLTLDLTVPVSQTVPVKLTVPVSLAVNVDIPLQQTELHRPFADLRDLFAPYYALVSALPESWTQALTFGYYK
ncbi:MAG: hypothetical protein HY872_08930 [Chloroflexi bacterium]|nr:hypothetical protein [Chloroflexota bacterium]MBI5828902.1 hypothetical protein [Chloroflexota bacterium]